MASTRRNKTTDYLEQKVNLESQGWRMFQKIGPTTYWIKNGVAGIIYEIDVHTGKVIINRDCPDNYFEQHKAELLRRND